MCVCTPDCTTRVLEFLVCREVNESTYLWFNIELYLLFTTMYIIHALHGTLLKQYPPIPFLRPTLCEI